MYCSSCHSIRLLLKFYQTISKRFFLQSSTFSVAKQHSFINNHKESIDEAVATALWVDKITLQIFKLVSFDGNPFK